MCTAWRHSRRIEAAGMPAVTEFSDAPPRPGAMTADPNRRGGLLHWTWGSLHILVLVKGPPVVHHPVRPEIADNAQAFIAERATLGKGGFQGAKLLFHPAH